MQVRNKTTSIFLTLSLVFLLLSFLVCVSIWWVFANRPVCSYAVSKKECPEISLIIKIGEGLDEVAQLLQTKNLIKNSLIFKIQVIRFGLAKKIQAGEFLVSSTQTPLEIANLLTKGNFDKKVTIIEGLRAEEIGLSLMKQGLGINPTEWLAYIRANNLEGKLFPDTYMIHSNARVDQVVAKMQSNFEKKFDQTLINKGLEKELSREEILILASLVEREVHREPDRPIVAGILIKRLTKNWPLQVDATVQYAVASKKCLLMTANRSLVPNSSCEWWPKRLTEADLKIQSPYNTYLYKGLPPVPICNPGLSAVKAVVYAQDSPYWFYLSDLSGKIYYARSDLEQAENIKKYLWQ